MEEEEEEEREEVTKGEEEGEIERRFALGFLSHEFVALIKMAVLSTSYIFLLSFCCFCRSPMFLNFLV